MPPRRFSLITVPLLIVALLLAATPASAAVTMAAKSATPQGSDVLISWETGTETNTVGFFIQRSLQYETGYARISDLIRAEGQGGIGTTYHFLDENVEYGVLYYYKIEVFNTDQSTDFEGPLWSGVGLTPTPPPTRVPSATARPTATRRPSATRTPRPPTATTRPPAPTAQGPIATWTVPPLPTSRPSATALPSPTLRSFPSATSATGAVQPSATTAPQPSSTSAPADEPSATPFDDGQEVGQPPTNAPSELLPTEPPLTLPTVMLDPETGEIIPGMAEEIPLSTPEIVAELPPGGAPTDESLLPGAPGLGDVQPTPSVAGSSAQAAEMTPGASGAEPSVVAALAPTAQSGADETAQVAGVEETAGSSNADRMRQALLILVVLLAAYQGYRYVRSRQQSE